MVQQERQQGIGSACGFLPSLAGNNLPSLDKAYLNMAIMTITQMGAGTMKSHRIAPTVSDHQAAMVPAIHPPGVGIRIQRANCPGLRERRELVGPPDGQAPCKPLCVATDALIVFGNLKCTLLNAIASSH